MAAFILSDIAKECADFPGRVCVKNLDEAHRVGALLNAATSEDDGLPPGAAMFRYGPSVPTHQTCFYCSQSVAINKHTVRTSIKKMSFYPAYHISVCAHCVNILNT